MTENKHIIYASTDVVSVCTSFLYITSQLYPPKYTTIDAVNLVTFFSIARILGGCSTIHSPHVLFFFFLKWRLACAH